MRRNLTQIALAVAVTGCFPFLAQAAPPAAPPDPMAMPAPAGAVPPPMIHMPQGTFQAPAMPVPPPPVQTMPAAALPAPAVTLKNVPPAVSAPNPAAAAVPAAQAPAAQGAQTPAAVTAVPVPPVAAEPPPHSIMERFRTYTGPRTPAAMTALFTPSPKAAVRQTPEVVLSNGAASVTIETTLPASSGTAPNFAFSGAQMLSRSLGKNGLLRVEALPETGAATAELIILSGSSSMEIPLNIAPALPADIDVSERAFVTFLNDKDPATKIKRDLNGDGRNDYQDDYIFAANYLLNKADTSTTTVRSPDQTRSGRTWEAPAPVAELTDPTQSAGGAKSSATPGTPAAPGSESVSAPAFSSGWANSSGTTATTTGTGGTNTITNIITAPASNSGSTTSAGNNTSTGTNTNTNTNTNTGSNTNQNSTGSTRVTVTGSGISKITTLTSADGSVTTTYIGEDTNSLNMRNQKAKERLQSIKPK